MAVVLFIIENEFVADCEIAAAAKSVGNANLYRAPLRDQFDHDNIHWPRTTQGERTENYYSNPKHDQATQIRQVILRRSFLKMRKRDDKPFLAGLPFLSSSVFIGLRGK
jgi:hypothetical protein